MAELKRYQSYLLDLDHMVESPTTSAMIPISTDDLVMIRTINRSSVRGFPFVFLPMIGIGIVNLIDC